MEPYLFAPRGPGLTNGNAGVGSPELSLFSDPSEEGLGDQGFSLLLDLLVRSGPPLPDTPGSADISPEEAPIPPSLPNQEISPPVLAEILFPDRTHSAQVDGEGNEEGASPPSEAGQPQKKQERAEQPSVLPWTYPVPFILPAPPDQLSSEAVAPSSVEQAGKLMGPVSPPLSTPAGMTALEALAEAEGGSGPEVIPTGDPPGMDKELPENLRSVLDLDLPAGEEEGIRTGMGSLLKDGPIPAPGLEGPGLPPNLLGESPLSPKDGPVLASAPAARDRGRSFDAENGDGQAGLSTPENENGIRKGPGIFTANPLPPREGPTFPAERDAEASLPQEGIKIPEAGSQEAAIPREDGLKLVLDAMKELLPILKGGTLPPRDPVKEPVDPEPMHVVVGNAGLSREEAPPVGDLQGEGPFRGRGEWHPAGALEKGGIYFKSEENRLWLRLEPELLGEIRGEIELEHDRIKAHFVAESPMAKEALEGSRTQLKEAFGEQGLSLDGFSVTVAAQDPSSPETILIGDAPGADEEVRSSRIETSLEKSKELTDDFQSLLDLDLPTGEEEGIRVGMGSLLKDGPILAPGLEGPGLPPNLLGGGPLSPKDGPALPPGHAARDRGRSFDAGNGHGQAEWVTPENENGLRKGPGIFTANPLPPREGPPFPAGRDAEAALPQEGIRVPEAGNEGTAISSQEGFRLVLDAMKELLPILKGRALPPRDSVKEPVDPGAMHVDRGDAGLPRGETLPVGDLKGERPSQGRGEWQPAGTLERGGIYLKPEENRVWLRLEPELLGEIRGELELEHDRIKAHFVAESPMAKEALEGSLTQLKEALGEQGLRLDSFSVTVASNGQHHLGNGLASFRHSGGNGGQWQQEGGAQDAWERPGTARNPMDQLNRSRVDLFV